MNHSVEQWEPSPIGASPAGRDRADTDVPARSGPERRIGGEFLLSASTVQNPLMPSAEFPGWLDERRRAHAFEVEPIPFRELEGWSFEPSTGNLVHVSGRFFKIEGIWVETNYGRLAQWSQPIISQPEIGILGIITRKIGGVLHFLMQAKMEPGNVNTVQLAPTLQATRSNFTRVHRGRTPPYLEYFTGRAGVHTLVDVLQSEQGARFFRKRNRNVIVEVSEDVPVLDDYCWLTLGQIQRLLSQNNIVNMDARTVLACIPFVSCGSGSPLASLDGQAGSFRSDVLESLVDSNRGLHSTEELLGWFTQLKFRYDLNVEHIPLKYVQSWVKTEDSIYHKDGKYFSVIAVRVRAANREVPGWTQPLVRPREEGIVAFVMQRMNGVLHFLVQAKVEPGNFDVVEMAPTVQCLTGSYRSVAAEARPPFLDYVLQAPPAQDAALHAAIGGRRQVLPGGKPQSPH